MNHKRKNYVVRNVLKEEIKKYLKERQLQERNGRGLGSRLPVNVKKDALHTVLGIPDDKLVDDYSIENLVTRQKKAIDSGKIAYATMIRRLNWQAVMNKTKNPEVTQKFRGVIKGLHNMYEK